MIKFLFALGFIVGILIRVGHAEASTPGVILNGYAAWDYCSCRYVVGQSEKHCKSQIGVGFPLPHGKIRKYEVDLETEADVKKRMFIIVGRKHPENVRVAYYSGTRLGCRLLPPGQTEIKD